MAHFLVVAADGADDDAVERRRKARPLHLDRIRPFVGSGVLVFAAARLDGSGAPRGSVFALDLDSRTAVDDWIAADPYSAHGVWASVQVSDIHIGVRDGTLLA